MWIEEMQLTLPQLTEAEFPFWERCSKEELALPYCPNCGKFHHYPRAFCPFCTGRDLEWRPISGKGTVYSFSIVYRARTTEFQARVPYVLALVELLEGPRLLTNIVVDQPNKVKIGLPVQVAFRKIEDGFAVPVFRLDDIGHSAVPAL